MNQPQVVGQPTTHQHFSYGINRMADLLAPTLGPTGGVVVNHQPSTSNKIEFLDDSATIVRRILSLGSPQHDVGAMVMRNLIWRVGQTVGDGGTVAAILARAIYNESRRMVAAGANSVRVTSGINKAVDVAIASLREQAKVVDSENDLVSVARTIIGEDALSAMVGEMSFLLGPDAHVVVEKYVAPYLQRRYVAGSHYKADILSMYFYTQAEQKKTVLSAPAIALTEDRLSTVEEVLPLMEAAIRRGFKSLVIVAMDVKAEALGMLVSNNQLPEDKKKLDLLAVKLKDVGDERRWALQDLALMTGATVLGNDMDRKTTLAVDSDLGEAQRAEYFNKAFVVVSNPSARAAIQQEVTMLRNYVTTLRLDEEDRPKIVKRLGRLTGGIGELKVGANSKLERQLMHDNAERAFKVLSAAQYNGVIAGGGGGYLHCLPALQALIDTGTSPSLNGSGPIMDDEVFGVQVVMQALQEPMRQILVNTGVSSPAVYIQRVQDAGGAATFDAMSGEVVDAFEGGVLDVTDVSVTSLKTAASGATMALSTDAIVYHKKPEQSLEP
ncbi:MAG: TCP-1/cpn60 chaperonin family protein [Chloroflexota bacterium]